MVGTSRPGVGGSAEPRRQGLGPVGLASLGARRSVEALVTGVEKLPKGQNAHVPGQTVSIDFFRVPTITMKVLFVFLVLEHRRREVLHFNVTELPVRPGRPSRSSRPLLIRMHPNPGVPATVPSSNA